MMRWSVISPEYGMRVPILDDGSGPMEYGCDVIEVEADTKREALVKGVRAMRADRDCHYLRFGDQDCSPFTGMKAEPMACYKCGNQLPDGPSIHEDEGAFCNHECYDQWLKEAMTI